MDSISIYLLFFFFNFRSVFVLIVSKKNCAIFVLISIFVFIVLNSFLLNIGKESFVFFLFCFNFPSVLIVLISFLLNIGNEMCYFCFNFCSIFLLISFLLYIRKEMSIFLVFMSVLNFIVLVSFLLNIGQKTKPNQQYEKQNSIVCRLIDLLCHLFQHKDLV